MPEFGGLISSLYTIHDLAFSRITKFICNFFPNGPLTIVATVCQDDRTESTTLLISLMKMICPSIF